MPQDPPPPGFKLSEVVIWGERIRYTYPVFPDEDDGTGPVLPEVPGVDPIEEPEQVCVDISAEGSAEKLAYLVKFAIAQAVKSIMQQNAVGEYGIAAYVHNGELRPRRSCLLPPGHSRPGSSGT